MGWPQIIAVFLIFNISIPVVVNSCHILKKNKKMINIHLIEIIISFNRSAAKHAI